jgi:hypothetical protein
MDLCHSRAQCGFCVVFVEKLCEIALAEYLPCLSSLASREKGGTALQHTSR